MADPPGDCPECGQRQPSGFWSPGWVETADATGARYQPCATCQPRQHTLWRQRAANTAKRHQHRQ